MGLFDWLRSKPQPSHSPAAPGPEGRNAVTDDETYRQWYRAERKRNEAKFSHRSQTACPYCSTQLNPPPKRKKACPACGETIVVRMGLLVTEEEGTRFDIQRDLDIDEVEWATEEDRLRTSFGHQPSPRDVRWGILTKRVTSGDTGAMFSQARVLFEEGRDPTGALRTFHEFRWRGANGHLRISADACCPDCAALDGKTINASQLRALKLLPQPGCTRERNEAGASWCNCAYRPA